MLIKTKSGSIYELDQENKRIRRLSNSQGTSPVKHLGIDMEWISYDYLWPPPEVGMCLIVGWNGDDHTMMTTAIVEIINDKLN